MELFSCCIDLFLKIVGVWIYPKEPEIVVCLDEIHTYSGEISKLNAAPICFNIYRCVNHNRNNSSVFCYMILCDRSERMDQLDIAFKELYRKHFYTIPTCIGVYADHPNHTDIEYVFRLFYRRNHKKEGFIYCRYGLLYLHNMTEEEFLIKFRFLYQDSGKTLTNRTKIDKLYSTYLMTHYPKKDELQSYKKIEEITL